ncbi:VOC family protein [Enterococcus rivorum]|uniref:Glyoxylase n=1 Tax=Enterococcus rivorum TaxID=762845 RepID=A0A1E5KV17_9ENTE|nr:VOC family protein [Enterococcus rivorum]MBP2100353.1 catechol 2,3-dioxygenase-like lactoylglutathione lyase family enzyme [Enterococcus rivorum]OEH81736.1 glyoxylase [Enterococcus rivorum]
MRLDMVGIICEDVEKSSLFYERLGFQTIGEKSNDYLELDNENIRISLNSKKMVEGIYGFVPSNQGEKIELAFLCDSPEQVDSTCEKMIAFGYDLFKEPWDAFWGQRYAIIKDLDNNLLALFANLENEEA